MENGQRTHLQEILKDELAQKKNRNPSYSIRAFARDIKVPYTAIARLLNSGTELNPKHKLMVGLYLKVPKDELLSFIFENDS